MVGNKAGINDSIKKRRLKGSRHRRQAARSCKYERDRNGPAWQRLYRKISGGVVERPLARGLRGNLTHADESRLQPDRSLFECNPKRSCRAPSGRACVLAYFLEKLTDAR
jgi:hypothetical protein